MHRLTSFMFVALAACGGSPKPSAPATPAAPVATAPAGVLELGELQFFDGDDLGLKIHANGHVEMKMEHDGQEMWHDFVTIAADGTVTHDGQPHLTVNADGTVALPGGTVLPFKLDGATLVVGDNRFTLDAKGYLQGGPDQKIHVDGATTPGLQRTALVVLAIMLTAEHGDEAHEAPAPTTP